MVDCFGHLVIMGGVNVAITYTSFMLVCRKMHLRGSCRRVKQRSQREP